MTCPYYVDFTRDCRRTYPMIIEHRDFTPCESEGYHRCLVYNILKSDFRCQHLDTCLNMFPSDLPDFYTVLNQNRVIYDYVTKPVYQYCLSKDNHVHCARYKLKQDGQEPPPGLNPDGNIINIADSTHKNKIVFEKAKKL